MDNLLKINWDQSTDQSNSFFSSEVFASSSSTYHQLYSIHQSLWPSENKSSSLIEVNDLNARKWTARNLKRAPMIGINGTGNVLVVEAPKPLPKNSVLGANEQKDYLFSILRVRKALMNGTPPDFNDLKVLKEMQGVIKQEMQEFQTLAQTIMLQNPSCYSFLDPGIEKYVSEAWQAQLSRLNKYPENYKLIGNVTLVPKEDLKKLNLNLEANILNLGRIPAQFFPAVNSIVKVCRAYKIINKKYPSNNVSGNTMSEDSNARKLSSKYGVEIAISADTMRKLAGSTSPFFKQAWDIPFVVQDMNVNGEVRKTIYIDDPLPPMEMSTIEKNNAFNLHALKVQFTNYHFSRYYVYPGSEAVQGKSYTDSEIQNNEEDVFDAVDTDIGNLETFGVEKSLEMLPPPPKGDAQNVASPTKVVTDLQDHSSTASVATDSDSSDASLMIDLGDGSAPSPSKKKKIKRSEKVTKAEGSANLLSSILEGQEKMMVSQRKAATSQWKKPKEEPENPLHYNQPDRRKNVSYHTWILEANERSIRLLVRSSVDTAIVTSQKEVKPFLMVSKLEYQPWYGAECITPRELREQWIDLHLRPGCQQLRMRVDAYTGDFIMSEQKNEACLLAEAQFQFGDAFRPNDCLQQIWAVLSSLKDMDLVPGNYLMRHGKNDGICVQLWSATTEKGTSTMNLGETYGAVDVNASIMQDAAENWIALDPWTVMPFQRVLNRPPLVFNPSDSGERNQKKKANANPKNASKGKGAQTGKNKGNKKKGAKPTPSV